MQLVEGMFSQFKACWKFEILTEQACKVSLQMEFEFDSGVMNFALEILFNSSSNNLVDAVVKRAQFIYG
jgi:ribosome-associated toxin RatA of RatAB toxin-antitoxin module